MDKIDNTYDWRIYPFAVMFDGTQYLVIDQYDYDPTKEDEELIGKFSDQDEAFEYAEEKNLELFW